MPALSNQRQELFCQLLKRGMPAIKAYPLAGYNAHRSAPARLCGNVRVKQRLTELTRHIAVKTRVTVETISAQLDEDRAFAKAVEQAGPALNATIAKAKLHGLIIDKKEQGAPGDFAGAQTKEDVEAIVRAELGDEAAALLMAILAKTAPADLPAEPAPVLVIKPEPEPGTRH